MPIDQGVIKRWIRENIESIGTREEIAHHFGISLRALEKEFHRQEGVTLAEFTKREKYRRVRILLESTDLRCYEIGLRLALGTPESMAKAFRRRYGLTMLEYRKRFR